MQKRQAVASEACISSQSITVSLRFTARCSLQEYKPVQTFLLAVSAFVPCNVHKNATHAKLARFHGSKKPCYLVSGRVLEGSRYLASGLLFRITYFAGLSMALGCLAMVLTIVLEERGIFFSGFRVCVSNTNGPLFCLIAAFLAGCHFFPFLFGLFTSSSRGGVCKTSQLVAWVGKRVCVQNGGVDFGKRGVPSTEPALSSRHAVFRSWACCCSYAAMAPPIGPGHPACAEPQGTRKEIRPRAFGTHGLSCL